MSRNESHRFGSALFEAFKAADREKCASELVQIEKTRSPCGFKRI